MRLLILMTASTLLCGQLLGQANKLTKEEKKEGYKLLFDGKTLKGWTPNGTAKWMVTDGAITTPAGGNGWLRSDPSFTDFVLRMEFRAAADANSGVFLRSAATGEPHITGYELQIWNVNPNPKYKTGSFVNHATAKDAAFKGNEWNTYEVTAKGDHFVVKLNGDTVLDTHDSKSKGGHIGFQSNKFKMEFRNIKVKAL